MNLKSTSGFSLLEIAVAMIILGFVVAGIFALFTTTHKHIISAGHRLEAVKYAQTVLEQLRVYVSQSENYDVPAGTIVALPYQQNQQPQTRRDPTDTQGLGLAPLNIPGTTSNQCFYYVTPIDTDTSGFPQLREVTVRVTWTEQ